jgi:hypothetical protein
MRKEVNVFTGDNIRSISITPIAEGSSIYQAEVVAECNDIVFTYKIPNIQFNDSCSFGVNKKIKEGKPIFSKGTKYQYNDVSTKLNINISADILANGDGEFGVITEDISKLKDKKDKESFKIN